MNATERKLVRLSPIAIRVRNGRGDARLDLGQVRSFFEEDGSDLVFYLRLGAGHSISEHIKWMFGVAKHDSDGFKRSRQAGVDVVFEIISESSDFVLGPEDVLLPHKLQVPVQIRFKK